MRAALGLAGLGMLLLALGYAQGWDLLHVLRNFDPRWVSFHFDTGHATNAGGNNTWALNMRAAGPYVGGLSIKDSLFYLDLETPEGGPFTGTPAQLNTRPPGAGPESLP